MTDDPIFIRFLDPQGRTVRQPTSTSTEIRSCGAGWPWRDIQGAEWRTAGAPVEGESLPRWYRVGGDGDKLKTAEAVAEALQPIADRLMSLPDDVSTDMELIRGIVYIAMGVATAPPQVRKAVTIEVALAMEAVSRVMVREQRRMKIVRN